MANVPAQCKDYHLSQSGPGPYLFPCSASLARPLPSSEFLIDNLSSSCFLTCELLPDCLIDQRLFKPACPSSLGWIIVYCLFFWWPVCSWLMLCMYLCMLVFKLSKVSYSVSYGFLPFFKLSSAFGSYSPRHWTVTESNKAMSFIC